MLQIVQCVSKKTNALDVMSDMDYIINDALSVLIFVFIVTMIKNVNLV